MSLFSLAFSLFLLMDSVGNIPFFLVLLKNLEPKRQRRIIIRELIIALFVIILFVFLGAKLLDFLQITDCAIEISGGVILFLICLKMIFPTSEDKTSPSKEQEPFIVPLAIPLVAGPAVLAAVIVHAKQSNILTMIGAIFIAWIGSFFVLFFSSYLRTILGWRGLAALERLMGLILIIISIQMLLTGIQKFVASCI